MRGQGGTADPPDSAVSPSLLCRRRSGHSERKTVTAQKGGTSQAVRTGKPPGGTANASVTPMIGSGEPVRRDARLRQNAQAPTDCQSGNRNASAASHTAGDYNAVCHFITKVTVCQGFSLEFSEFVQIKQIRADRPPANRLPAGCYPIVALCPLSAPACPTRTGRRRPR